MSFYTTLHDLNTLCTLLSSPLLSSPLLSSSLLSRTGEAWRTLSGGTRGSGRRRRCLRSNTSAEPLASPALTGTSSSWPSRASRCPTRPISLCPTFRAASSTSKTPPALRSSRVLIPYCWEGSWKCVASDYAVFPSPPFVSCRVCGSFGGVWAFAVEVRALGATGAGIDERHVGCDDSLTRRASYDLLRFEYGAWVVGRATA